MVQFSKLVGTVAAAAFVAPAIAHPGEHHDHHAVKRQVEARNRVAARTKRSIDSCSTSNEARQVAARSAARRSKVVRELREKRGISSSPQKFRRDLATLEKFDAIDHNRTGVLNYDMNTPESIVFGGNTSCILSPEVTDGPYYVTGEQVRSNVKEDKYCDGIDLFLEVQYIDVNTCQPVPDVWVDIWNCNATGLYSGISTSGNYAADGLNSTYLRYVAQPTVLSSNAK